MCPSKHNILNSSAVPLVIFSDQNFPSCLSENEINCVGIVRLENATLHNLADIAFEVFEKNALPSGTVVLLGNGSHLFRMGDAAYAYEWTQVVTRLSSKWQNHHFLPLPPMISTECQGSIVRDLLQLGVWISKVYQTTGTGLVEVCLGGAEGGGQLHHWAVPPLT